LFWKACPTTKIRNEQAGITTLTSLTLKTKSYNSYKSYIKIVYLISIKKEIVFIRED